MFDLRSGSGGIARVRRQAIAAQPSQAGRQATRRGEERAHAREHRKRLDGETDGIKSKDIGNTAPAPWLKANRGVTSIGLTDRLSANAVKQHEFSYNMRRASDASKSS